MMAESSVAIFIPGDLLLVRLAQIVVVGGARDLQFVYPKLFNKLIQTKNRCASSLIFKGFLQLFSMGKPYEIKYENFYEEDFYD